MMTETPVNSGVAPREGRVSRNSKAAGGLAAGAVAPREGRVSRNCCGYTEQ